jgi:t-SNARE syntaxin family protein
VRAIEHDPYRYGLELDEVERRRKLVQEVGAEIESMREELQKAVTTSTAIAAGAAHAAAGGLPNPSAFDGLLPSPGGGAPGGTGGADGDEDYYGAYEQERQLELMQQQDNQLDGVFRTVGTLRQQADVMGRELEDQAVLLDDVDNLADRVGGKLSDGVKRIRHIVRKNEGERNTIDICLKSTKLTEQNKNGIDTMSSCCIAILIAVLVLLLILILVL